MSHPPTDIRQLADILGRSRRILIFTGAGISTGSGIPDFRGPNGVWKTRQPVYYQDFMKSEAARIEHWDYKLETWDAFRDARPNATHRAIRDLETLGRLEMVVTQNIDGLHAKAGTSKTRLVELHGTNLAVSCQSCGEQSDPQPHFDAFRKARTPPCCPCGGYLKPATISFGQSLPEDALNRAMAAANATDCVIALGSSLSVYPASEVPVIAMRTGAEYIIINRGTTAHDGLEGVSLRLEGDVEDLFPKAVQFLADPSQEP